MTEALTVYLFENDAEDTFGVCRTAQASALPAPRAGTWTLKLKFDLAVDQPNPIGIAPEPVLRGLAANGYFVWSRHEINPFGTSQ
jgi:hypothetical protein